MFEKNMQISFLLDFYGDVLNPKTKRILNLYYNDDLSLSEIARDENISRQGIRSIIKKGEEELLFLEEKLGLAKQYSSLSESASKIEEYLTQIQNNTLQDQTPFLNEVQHCISLITES